MRPDVEALVRERQLEDVVKSRVRTASALTEKLLAYGDQAVHIGQHQLYCHVDYLKVAVLDALEEVGCKFLVHLAAVDTLMEGNRVAGVVGLMAAEIFGRTTGLCKGKGGHMHLFDPETTLALDKERDEADIRKGGAARKEETPATV